MLANNFFDSLFCKILLLDSAIYFLTGILLFFSPKFIGDSLLNRSTDGVHWHLIRCVGGQLIASSFLSWRSSCSLRCIPEVRTTCMVLRLLAGIMCSFYFIHTRAVHMTSFEPDIMRGLIWFSLATVFISFFILIISGWSIGDRLYRENRWGNILYQCDTIAAIAIGTAWVVDPKWLLYRQVRVKLDYSHDFCGRLMGLLFISSQVISAHALHWSQPSDRAMAAEARAILCLCILSAQIWSQIAYGEHWSDKHWVGISLFSTWTAIAVLYRAYLWYSAGDGTLSVAEWEKCMEKEQNTSEMVKKAI